jgi:hypothetical protein
MTALRVEAVLTWAYAAGFGGSTIPVAVYLRRHGRLPTFFGLFDMDGGPWSSRFGQRAFVCLLIGFDLPIPKVIGPVRIVFLARGWRSLH